ncbi:MAG: hypothetical protein WBA74_25895 [Cyclobacteriaceae bacterium]
MVLENALDFFDQKQNISVEKAIEIGNELIDTAEAICEFPFKGQKEELLIHL